MTSSTTALASIPTLIVRLNGGPAISDRRSAPSQSKSEMTRNDVAGAARPSRPPLVPHLS